MDEINKYLKKTFRTFWAIFAINMFLGLLLLGGIAFAIIYLLKTFL